MHKYDNILSLSARRKAPFAHREEKRMGLVGSHFKRQNILT